MKHLVTFLVDVPEDHDSWDFDEIREQVGSGAADIYSDESIDPSVFDEQPGIT